jgi:hypothetical protein
MIYLDTSALVKLIRIEVESDALDDEQAAEFYRHFDFHDLYDRRLWRRLSRVSSIFQSAAYRRSVLWWCFSVLLGAIPGAVVPA